MIQFKKTISKTIYISDNKEKYEIVHPYFSFSNSEIPYDSNIFKQCLESKEIVVVSIDDESYKWDFSKYLEHDEYIVEQKAIEEKIKEEVKVVKQKEAIKKEKIKKKEEEKKKKEEEKKKLESEKVELISDEEILKKL